MSYQITLDAGTTNTRAFLWKEGKDLLAWQSREIGVACTAVDGNSSRLQAAVRSCVEGLLRETDIDAGKIECVLASGMITSNMGLLEIPHLIAPVGIEDLARGMVRAELPEVTGIPFRFIPGVKNRVDADRDFAEMDMMRGEEVEAVALLETLPPHLSYLLVLPGSHTKFVAAAQRKITGCLTTLTGELLSVLTRQTILADAVDRKFVGIDDYSPELVKLGYRTAKREGLARAAFLARILAQQAGYAAEQTANYLLGTVLEQDLRALSGSKAVSVDRNTKIVISGKEVLCRALLDLMKENGEFPQVLIYPAEKSLSSMGALAVYREAVSIGL